jgi:two-component system sensor histidine kinase PilS (NtrC family)
MVASSPVGRNGQRARLFRVYNYYRIAVSLLLVSLLLLETDLLGAAMNEELLFQGTALAYLAINILTGLLLLAGYPLRPWHITVSILADIFFLHLLALSSGGVGTGIINLVIISIAAGNILIPGRVGIFYAALAALASLAVSFWLLLEATAGIDDIVRAGVMGIIYFATAFILQNITHRLASSERLATERARSIAELEQLNHQIIQRMHTGIVVANPTGIVRMANAAAGELLQGERRTSPPLTTLPAPLMQRMKQWLENPGTRTQPFQAREDTPGVQANFTPLDQPVGDHILIFLEDTSKIIQQAQQMKLASLGRLTAGIAHEVRNPLGAISHAAQLMAESPDITEADRRMTGIIQRHSERVNAIIENILQLSRRRSADVRLVDLGEWLASVVNEYRECGGDGNIIDLKLSGPAASARFDPSQLHQALINLVDNGLRYSEKNTGRRTLTLSTGVTEDGQRAYIDVRDQGPGLNDKQRASLFEPFFTTEQQGTGLGLYLARELCEANQARLILLGSNEQGSCFRITFAHPGKRTLDYTAAPEVTGTDT